MAVFAYILVLVLAVIALVGYFTAPPAKPALRCLDMDALWQCTRERTVDGRMVCVQFTRRDQE